MTKELARKGAGLFFSNDGGGSEWEECAAEVANGAITSTCGAGIATVKNDLQMEFIPALFWK